ncbi:FadR/GntR family transcriptional regulator [Actinoallomurus sp. NPDC050550]|uniref:FadR/GntR family transcriptional regulator n=1 Tax=Actinoallomurus sp. NPDC050550 TaxID=3154937 RepID=UPI0033F7EB88
MTDRQAPRGLARRVGGQVQHEIMQLILDRRLRSGDLLPTETELMEDLGVSRNSIREALKGLQALDIVEVRHGYGTYVGQLSLTPLADGLTFRTLHELGSDVRALSEILQVREILEAGLIRRVATTIPDDDLAALDAVVRRMETRARAGETFAEEDRQFHELLYRSLGNALVPQFLEVFWKVFDRVSGIRGWNHDPSPIGTVRRHRAIVTALRRRDVEAAEQALSKHFRNIDTRVEKAARRDQSADEADRG